MLNKIKSLFKKKEKGIWVGLDKVEQEILIENLITRILDLEEDRLLLINEIGEMPTYCDKCDVNRAHNCIKCGGTGIVKKNRLMSWNWQ